MSDTSDILEVQDAIYYGLLSCALFDDTNVVQERKFLAEQDLEFAAIWQTPRGEDGKVGAGLYVEMPRLELPKPNSLQRHLIVSVGVLEERNLNMSAAGTQKSAEEWAELVLEFLFGWGMPMSSQMVPEVGAIKPAPDLVDGEGLVAYRTAISMRRERRPMSRCDAPIATSGDGGTWVLANGENTPAADIYYTLDGSLPGAGNPAAVKYSGPVMVGSEVTMLCAAWAADGLPSHVVRVN